MADQKTKGDGTQGEHTYGVLPMNMGKSLKFGDKVYNVNVGQTLQVTENGLVEVKLSQTAGNLLQQYDDGLYYGIQAPANVSSLFVDAVNGVDQDPNVVKGAGTRAKPLKTIAYAYSLVPKRSSTTVYLMEDQDHIVDTMFTVDLVETTIRPYGPKTEANFAVNRNIYTTSYNSIFGDDVYAPRMVLARNTTRVDNQYNRHYVIVDPRIITFVDCSINIFGVRIVNDLSWDLQVGVTAYGNLPNANSQLQYSYNETPYRIVLQKNSVLMLSRSELMTKGTPRVSWLSNSLTSWKNPFYFMEETDRNGNYYNSIFYSSQKGTIKLYQVKLSDLKCFIAGTHGWSEYVADLLNISSLLGMNKQEICNHYYLPQITVIGTGDNAVCITPLSNIEGKYWYKAKNG